VSIELEKLTKRFGSSTAVDEISVEIPQGAFFCIVGASGCGKSTLLRLIAGLEEPSDGRISLGGSPVAAPGLFVPPEDRSVGVVFQSYALWPHLTVEGNVAFPFEARGLARAEALAEAQPHIRTVALEALKDRKPDALSGGQRQRVALARCLAGEAQTILMDEPLANLDPHLRAEMEGELKAFHRRSEVTTLYITHDQREAMALADVMAVMHEGRFLQVGTPHEIYARPRSAQVAGFIGRGSVLDVPVRDGRPMLGGQSLPIDAAGLTRSAVRVLLRPRDFVQDEAGFPVTVTEVHYRGGLWEAQARLSDGGEEISLDLDRPATPGDRLHIRITQAWVLPE